MTAPSPDLTPTPSPTPAPAPVQTPAGAGVPTEPGIDPRGPRWGAAVTSVLLVVTLALALGPGTRGAAGVLLAVVALSFLVGAVRGVQGTWQGALYRTVVAPRLRPTPEREDPRPPRFAQLVGLVITGLGVVLGLVWPAAVAVAAGLALVAALLNAVVGLCLGCELYVLARRVRA